MTLSHPHTHTPCPILDRVQRLKDARAEAAKDIEELKASKNEAFVAFEQEVCGPCPCPRVLRFPWRVDPFLICFLSAFFFSLVLIFLALWILRSDVAEGGG